MTLASASCDGGGADRPVDRRRQRKGCAAAHVAEVEEWMNGTPRRRSIQKRSVSKTLLISAHERLSSHHANISSPGESILRFSASAFKGMTAV